MFTILKVTYDSDSDSFPRDYGSEEDEESFRAEPERENPQNTNVKMFKRSLSWFILVFTLLEFVVRTQLTAYDNSHGFISNNHDRYLANEISSMQEELASDIRSAAINKFNLKLQLKFDPEFLDFKQRPLGVPHLEKVTLFNVDKNHSVDMTSISGNTVHFHSSFFEDKKIPPLGNTSFNVVFLGREEGSVESNLFIHTTEGHFKYHVKGASVYSPYRLRPIVGIKLPVNTTFTPLIYLYNPFLEPIQIVEIYSSGGEFNLELPTGELEGPKDIWEIPPLQTKAVIKIRFFANSEQNHTAYIRIKLNNTDDILVVPLEVEVTSNALLYAPQGYIDFGVGGSLDPAKELKLKLNNPFKKSIRIQSITTTSRAVKIEYDKRVPSSKDDTGSVDVASLKLNWSAAFEHKDYSGKIIIKYKNSKSRTEIPYYLTVIEGGLTFNRSTTRYFISDKPEKVANRKMTVKNDFLTPIMLINITLPQEAQKFFHVSDFSPVVLKDREEKVIFTLKVNTGVTLANLKIDTHIFLNTNISSFEFPLVSYNGKFELRLPYKSKDNSLDLGLVSLESRKDTYILLVNKNPVVISVKQLLTSLPSSGVEIVGCAKGDYETALMQESYKNMTKCSQVKAGEYTILRLSVNTGRNEAQIWGDVSLQTQYEQLSIPVHFKVAHGKLEIGPDRLVFDQCFPGKICSHPLRVHSTFNEPMVIEDILSIPPDPRISSKHSGHITARATKIIGHLYLDPNLDCQNECYLGLHDENKANWWRTLSLSKSTTEFDLNLVNTLYNRYLNQTSNGLTRWQNLTMRLDTSEVKGHVFKTRVKMSWPSLLVDQAFENKTVYTFPLTQVGNVTYMNITIKNPSSYDLLVQIIMDQFYPGFDVLFEGLPPVFIPSNVEPLRKPKHGFFLEKTLANLFESFSVVHEATLPVRLKPNDNFTFRVGFKAVDATTNSAFLFLRNNLTVLEVLHLSGKGAYPSFKFGNRKPGSTQALLFELTEKHLKECETVGKKQSSASLFIKRSFTARNTGDVPVYINSFYINSLPCEGYGFKVLNCEPVALLPNATKKIDIAFTPDFTLAKVVRTLVLETSLNYKVNYTLVTTVPSYYLSLCSNIIMRPPWESLLYYITVGLMVFLLIFVVVVPLIESERILKEALSIIPRQSNTQHTLDLRLIGTQTRSELHSQSVKSEEVKKVVECAKQEEMKEKEKYTAVIPATGKTKKRNKKSVNQIVEVEEARKKNWVETSKLKSEETKPNNAQTQPQSEQESLLSIKKSLKKTVQPKKINVEIKNQIEVPAYEEETSSTTTESSNNEEVEKNTKHTLHVKNKPVKTSEGKSEEPNTHFKLERKKSNSRSNKCKENNKVDKGENQKANQENKPNKGNKKDRKDKHSLGKKLNIERSTKSDSSNNTSPSIRVSPSTQISSIWGENKASFSDVVARTESNLGTHPSRPLTQIQAPKPTMYVEPYKQSTSELGPIGSRKLPDPWQESQQQRSAQREEYGNFVPDAHNLAVENAFLDLTPMDTWSRTTSPILSLIQGNNMCTQHNHSSVQDSWMMPPHTQSQSSWDTFQNRSEIHPSPALSQNSNFLWGSSAVWQPITPSELPRTPTRTPPGFAIRDDDEERQRRQQNHLNYNPFGLNNIWTQQQQQQHQHPTTNPWNYPQGQ